MSLTLQLFGVPSLREAGREIQLKRRKAMALLSYLAVTGARHHRDVIEVLLWPESGEAAASQALRNVLWTIRQTSLSGFLHADRASVLLDTEELSVDALRFRALLSDCPSKSHNGSVACERCEPQLREAADLYVESFMTGFSVRNTVRFEDWSFAEAEAFRRELAELLDRLTQYYLHISEWELASQYARKWICEDRLNEHAYRRLMRSLVAQDKRGEVLHVFNECSGVLDEELGLAPDDATLRLVESIRSSTVAPDLGQEKTVSRLPRSLGPLIGRQEVVSNVETLLLDRQTRVVTLVGLGGAGKTSLALHIGESIAEEFADGAIWVPLDSRQEDTTVVAAVARAIGASIMPDERLAREEQIADLLRERRSLLILDGVEGVLPQVASLIKALDTANNLQILATSRIELGVPGEHTVVLPGLQTPEEGVAVDDMIGCPSIRLLKLASQRRGVSLEGDDAELDSMARLSRLVEGSPLALEMASAWRSVLSWDQIADRISRNLEFLRHPQVDVSHRQHNFIAVFEQSWLLLPSEAQRALRRLSVFRNGFAIRAAETITQSNPTALALLVNRCLLKRVGPDRFEMHTLLQQFASRKLLEHEDEAEQVRARHTRFYMAAASNWFADFSGPRQHRALASMDLEIANVSAAFEQAARSGGGSLLRDACEGMFFYYDILAKFESGKTVFGKAVRMYKRRETRDAVVEAFLEMAAGWFLAHDDPRLAVGSRMIPSELLEKDSSDDRLHAMLHVIWAYAKPGEDAPQHVRRLQQAIRVFQSLGELWCEGLALGAWASIEAKRDTNAAEELAQKSLQLHRECGDQWGEGLATCTLGVLAEAQGSLDLACVRYEESRRLVELFDKGRITVINLMIAQSRVLRCVGNAARSLAMAKEALDLSQRVGYRLQTAHALLEMADVNRQQGDLLAAKRLFEQSFGLLNRRGWGDLQSRCALSLCEIAVAEKNLGAGERWLREAEMVQPENPQLPALERELRELDEQNPGRDES